MDQLLLLPAEDLFTVSETLHRQNHYRQRGSHTSLVPEQQQQPTTSTTATASMRQVFHGLVLDMICSYLSPQDMVNLARACTVLSDNVLETLYRQNRCSAIRWACTRGTLHPLMNCLRFDIPLDRHLDVSQDRSFSCTSAAAATAVVLFKPTPLILALASGRVYVAEFLIEQGAGVNLPEGIIAVDDNDGHHFFPSSPPDGFPFTLPCY
ncbi:hypothetical protein PG994_007097 [Apiospora phragmitis]|uniref:F-box domain-containing protein n=1 Tax=Apiospora phragmitis TaxID=2905665 RepID=A0ABR1V306_9PEZI